VGRQSIILISTAVTAVLNFKALSLKVGFMEQIKLELIQEAKDKHGKIYPAGQDKQWEDCFTQQDQTLIFWFNLENNSTKAIIRELKN